MPFVREPSSSSSQPTSEPLSPPNNELWWHRHRHRIVSLDCNDDIHRRRRRHRHAYIPTYSAEQRKRKKRKRKRRFRRGALPCLPACLPIQDPACALCPGPHVCGALDSRPRRAGRCRARSRRCRCWGGRRSGAGVSVCFDVCLLSRVSCVGRLCGGLGVFVWMGVGSERGWGWSEVCGFLCGGLLFSIFFSFFFFFFFFFSSSSSSSFSIAPAAHYLHALLLLPHPNHSTKTQPQPSNSQSTFQKSTNSLLSPTSKFSRYIIPTFLPTPSCSSHPK